MSSEPVFEIVQELQPVKTEKAKTVEFVCAVSDERAEVKWFKDDKEVVEDGVKIETKSEERKRSLVIHDVSPEDEGQYTCQVGEQKTTSTLEIHEAEPGEEGKWFTPDWALCLSLLATLI